MRAAATLAFIVLAATVCAVACSGWQRGGSHASGSSRSNIVRADYAGSASCAPCHRAIYDRWLRSPMHRMTRVSLDESIRAPFDGGTFRFGTDAVTLFSEHGARFMRLAVAGQGESLWRITRVIGGRYREDYAAIHVDSTRQNAPAVGDPRAEMVMPVSWIFSTASWRYKGYSVMVRERPGMRAGPEWRSTCIFCHNTTPFFSSTFDELYGANAPRYQGQLHDNLLPASRAWTFRTTDRDVLRDALVDEIQHLTHRTVDDASLSVPGLLVHAIHATRADFDATDLVEVGVGCESCHNGSAAHVRDPRVRPTFEVQSGMIAEGPAHGNRPPTQAEWVNHTCARCHTVLFSHYPYTWEGGLRNGPSPGGSHINSGEARDFLLGGCSRAMTCVACHDPHTEDSAQDLHRIETPAGNALCTGCHAQYAGDAALRAHAHHAPGGEGALCVNCHMPRKNMGLDYHLTRYHRIGSPTAPERVEHDRPLECALCHADRSVRWIVDNMERWYGHHYDRAALVDLYGSLDANVMTTTLAVGLPHERAVAIGVFGHDRTRAALPLLVEQMDHEYPLVRYFALHAIGDITGQLPDWDMNQDGGVLVQQARAWLRASTR